MDQYNNNYQQTPPVNNWANQQVYNPAVKEEDLLPQKFKPLSPWAYFGYSLLFSIPLVGFIMLIVYSVNDDNINRRNFARSYWCVLALAVIISIIIGIITAVGIGIGFGSLNYYY